jgi:hypothetical protein
MGYFQMKELRRIIEEQDAVVVTSVIAIYFLPAIELCTIEDTGYHAAMSVTDKTGAS